MDDILISHTISKETDVDDDADGVLCRLDVLIITANRLPAQLSLSLSRDHSKFVGRARDTSISIEMHRLDVLHVFGGSWANVYICCTHHHTICNIHTRHTYTHKNTDNMLLLRLRAGD